MAIAIDREEAGKVLQDAVNASRSEELSPDHPWVQRISALWEACKGTNKTMIPILGTAILARATNIKVDPFALQAQSGPEGYDARGLCSQVLAAKARDYGIDLGVRSREPHNSQPFCFEPRVGLHMKAKSAPALKLLMDALTALEKTRNQSEAAEALQAFVQVRVLRRTRIQIQAQEGDHLDENDLVKLIKQFISHDAEKGNRPQVVLAGLLDTLFEPDQVAVGNPHDPTPNAAGDVRVLSRPKGKEVLYGFEVRYKHVDLKDLKLIVDSLERKSVKNFGVVAVAQGQQPFDALPEIRHAKKLGIRLSLFFGWDHIASYCVAFANQPGPAVGFAFRAILARMDEQNVSEEGIALWRAAKP